MKRGISRKIALMNPWLIFWLFAMSGFWMLGAMFSEGSPAEHAFSGIYALNVVGLLFGWPLAVFNLLSVRRPDSQQHNAKFYNFSASVAIVVIVIHAAYSGAEIFDNTVAKFSVSEIVKTAFGIFCVLVFVQTSYKSATILVQLEKRASIEEGGVFSTFVAAVYFPMLAFIIRHRIIALDNPEQMRSLSMVQPQEPFERSKGGIHPVVRRRLENALKESKKK